MHHRIQLGYRTFLVKLRAHRGDPYNELGDRAADTAASSMDTPLIWDASSGRPLCRWKEENSPDEHTTVKFNKRLRLRLQQSLLSHPLEPKPAPLGRKWKRIEPVLGLEWVPWLHQAHLFCPGIGSAGRFARCLGASALVTQWASSEHPPPRAPRLRARQ